MGIWTVNYRIQLLSKNVALLLDYIIFVCMILNRLFNHLFSMENDQHEKF